MWPRGKVSFEAARTNAPAPGVTLPHISIVHLSDIHFRTRPDVWDLDRDLRTELERDLAGLVAEHGPMRGIVVTGDVAFSGATKEYTTASEWLAIVAKIAKCRERDVWMVPGNHDVVRGKVSESKTIQEFHSRLRRCGESEIDDLLYEYLAADPSGGAAHFVPLENYIAFATRYECSITPQRPFWEDLIAIGDSGSMLRIRGMTSTLISDEHDDADGNRMVLGSAQSSVSREPGTIVMTMSHHPASWLRDGETVLDRLNTRAQIQLWGHRHTHRPRVIDGNLHLFAGAVHPERGAVDYEPRYNVLRIEVHDPGHATVTLFPRVWRRQESQFGPDFTLDGSASQAFPLAFESHVVETKEGEEPQAEDVVTEGPKRDARRALAFYFSSLPYQLRLEVARELDLLDPDARDLQDQELFEVVLATAARADRLSELWNAVQERHPGPTEANPFERAHSEGSAGG